MIIDCHVHSRGNEATSDILQGLDAAGLDQAVIFSPSPSSDGPEPAMTMRAASDWLAGVAATAGGRIIPFVWIEPTLPDALTALEYAVVDLGFKGIKMIPNHWYPTDEVVFPVYARAQELGVPILFHSGILFGHADGSRFCRPAFYEALIRFPRLRFALAHIGWPWVDECLAVAGRFRHEARRTGQPMQMWVDTCPGTPPLWRPEALQKAFAYLGDEHLLWGSDASAGRLTYAGEVLAGDRRILHSLLGANAEAEARWMGQNVARFLGL